MNVNSTKSLVMQDLLLKEHLVSQGTLAFTTKLSSKPEHSVKLFLLHVFHTTSVLIMMTCTIAATAIQMTVTLKTIIQDHYERAVMKLEKI